MEFEIFKLIRVKTLNHILKVSTNIAQYCNQKLYHTGDTLDVLAALRGQTTKQFSERLNEVYTKSIEISKRNHSDFEDETKNIVFDLVRKYGSVKFMYDELKIKIGEEKTTQIKHTLDELLSKSIEELKK